MTKAEAIAMLKRIQEPEAWEPQINQAAFEALDMAIEALSQESSEDVISRQAAIDLTWKDPSYSDPLNVLTEVRDGIKALPSAQPEIVRCKECKWWDKKDGSPVGYCHAAKHGYYSGHWEIEIYRTYKEDFYCADGEREGEE